ncbi:MAG: sensor histidine kinase, partial [Flavobacteriales bacterium]
KVTYNLEHFDIQEKCLLCVEDVQNLLKKGQTLNYSHEGASSSVFLDPQLTRNIMVNLLSNAVKYSSEGQAIELSTNLQNNTLIIEVADLGMGIPVEEQEHLFQRFFRAKNATNIQGTGLGLNIIKKYIDLMDGVISFTSAENQGTTFKVTLPAQKKSNG